MIRAVLPPSTSLPVKGEIAGVNTTSLGGYLHRTKTRARWAEGFHELNGHMFDLERDGLRQVVLAQDSPCDDNTQPYHTGSVAARINRDRAFRRTPGVLLVRYRRFEEETTSPSELGTQGL